MHQFMVNIVYQLQTDINLCVEKCIWLVPGSIICTIIIFILVTDCHMNIILIWIVHCKLCIIVFFTTTIIPVHHSPIFVCDQQPRVIDTWLPRNSLCPLWTSTMVSALKAIHPPPVSLTEVGFMSTMAVTSSSLFIQNTGGRRFHQNAIYPTPPS